MFLRVVVNFWCEYNGRRMLCIGCSVLLLLFFCKKGILVGNYS